MLNFRGQAFVVKFPVNVTSKDHFVTPAWGTTTATVKRLLRKSRERKRPRLCFGVKVLFNVFVCIGHDLRFLVGGFGSGGSAHYGVARHVLVNVGKECFLCTPARWATTATVKGCLQIPCEA